jgi:hypothetical protein
MRDAMKLAVTIVRTIKTVVEVEADSPVLAREKTIAYGMIEAASDFKVIDEGMTARISRTKKIN